MTFRATRLLKANLKKAGVLDVTRLLFIDGIQLVGLPTPPASPSQAFICPYTLQDSRFTVSRLTFSMTRKYHVTSWS